MNCIRWRTRCCCSGERRLNLRRRSFSSAWRSGDSFLKLGSFSSSLSCWSGGRSLCSLSQSPILCAGLGLLPEFLGGFCELPCKGGRNGIGPLCCVGAARLNNPAIHRIPITFPLAQLTEVLPQARLLVYNIVRRSARHFFDQICSHQNVLVPFQRFHIGHRRSGFRPG